MQDTVIMKKDIRPQFHFTPKKGWINDPNGLCYANGVYHMFYQHYPDDTKWGPMHWGHATSRDLLSWEHQEIALYPTEDEYCFSGSAIIDDEGVMRLFYTSHNPKTGEQTQSMAYSSDYIHFEKYDGNPIIENSKDSSCFKKDFRDPKVIKNKVKGGYTMVLAAGENIEFYSSSDFINWTYSGSFAPGKLGFGGICECPDLISFPEKDVLTMSIIVNPGQEDEYHVMQYFVGHFDGDTFVNEQPFQPDQLLDFGDDNYAMVSFSGTDEVILMGWGENWASARANTNTEYFGKMTLARKASLLKVGNRYLISQKPIVFDEKVVRLEAEGKVLITVEDEGYVEIFAENGTKSLSWTSRK